MTEGTETAVAPATATTPTPEKKKPAKKSVAKVARFNERKELEDRQALLISYAPKFRAAEYALEAAEDQHKNAKGHPDDKQGSYWPTDPKEKSA